MASSFTNLGCIEQMGLHPLEVAQNTIHPCPTQNWYKTSKVNEINLINFYNNIWKHNEFLKINIIDSWIFSLYLNLKKIPT